jgi:hypothetical protein
MYRAACSMDDPAADAFDVAKNIMALKVMVGRAGKLVGAEAIQLHGGMGITIYKILTTIYKISTNLH